MLDIDGFLIFRIMSLSRRVSVGVTITVERGLCCMSLTGVLPQS
jgi:hypothetical protein